METITASGTTDLTGTLTLSVQIGRPNVEFDAVIVLSPKQPANGQMADPWSAINAARQRLGNSREVFADSVDLIREDRDR